MPAACPACGTRGGARGGRGGGALPQPRLPGGAAGTSRATSCSRAGLDIEGLGQAARRAAAGEGLVTDPASLWDLDLGGSPRCPGGASAPPPSCGRSSRRRRQRPLWRAAGGARHPPRRGAGRQAAGAPASARCTALAAAREAELAADRGRRADHRRQRRGVLRRPREPPARRPPAWRAASIPARSHCRGRRRPARRPHVRAHRHAVAAARPRSQALLEAAGARVVGQRVPKKTSFVVVGADAGTKAAQGGDARRGRCSTRRGCRRWLADKGVRMVDRARVLLVDDDDGSRAAMALGLRRVGLEVIEVDCGEAAVRLLRERRGRGRADHRRPHAGHRRLRGGAARPGAAPRAGDPHGHGVRRRGRRGAGAAGRAPTTT